MELSANRAVAPFKKITGAGLRHRPPQAATPTGTEPADGIRKGSGTVVMMRWMRVSIAHPPTGHGTPHSRGGAHHLLRIVSTLASPLPLISARSPSMRYRLMSGSSRPIGTELPVLASAPAHMIDRPGIRHAYVCRVAHGRAHALS
jgi:hypothetical protein